MHLRHGSDCTYDTSIYKSDGKHTYIRHIERFVSLIPWMCRFAHLQAQYFADLVKAYREEIVELYYLGCRNVQFDDPTFAFFCTESMPAGMKQAGVDPEVTLDMYIRVYNEILKNRPADLTATLHTCRGNYRVRPVQSHLVA